MYFPRSRIRPQRYARNHRSRNAASNEVIGGCHLAHNPKVAGSNPPPLPSKPPETLRMRFRCVVLSVSVLVSVPLPNPLFCAAPCRRHSRDQLVRRQQPAHLRSRERAQRVCGETGRRILAEAEVEALPYATDSLYSDFVEPPMYPRPATSQTISASIRGEVGRSYPTPYQPPGVLIDVLMQGLDEWERQRPRRLRSLAACSWTLSIDHERLWEPEGERAAPLRGSVAPSPEPAARRASLGARRDPRELPVVSANVVSLPSKFC